MIVLGSIVKDTITGFSGMAVGRTEYLHGCIRIGVQPTTLHEGKILDVQWFDEPQIEVVTQAKKASRVETGGPRSAPSRTPDPRR